MIRYYTLFFLFLINFSSTIFSQSVSFHDPYFQKAILEQFDANKNAIIEISEIENIDHLFLVNKGIKSIIDLKLFPNLEMVILDENSIENIELIGLPKLRFFSCAHCKTKSFKAGQMPNLSNLYLDNNQIILFSINQKLPLIQLTLSYNKLTKISLENLNSLEKINLEHNLLSKINLSKNTKISSVNLLNNPIKSYDVILPQKKNIHLFIEE